jgi:hypothetical protein
VAVFVNKGPRLTHEWHVHIGSPRCPSPAINAALEAEADVGSRRALKRDRVQHDDSIKSSRGGARKEKWRGFEEAFDRVAGTFDQPRGWRPPEVFEGMVDYVVFELDRSFHHPQRKVTSLPFVTSGEGWGEHTVTIRVHFRPHLQLPPAVVLHSVLLHHTIVTPLRLGGDLLLADPPKRLVGPDDPCRPVVAQRRDHFVLCNAPLSVLHHFLQVCAGVTRCGGDQQQQEVGRALLPGPVADALRGDRRLAADLAAASAALLDAVPAELEAEMVELLQQIESKEKRLEGLLAKGRELIQQQQDRCDRLQRQ